MAIYTFEITELEGEYTADIVALFGEKGDTGTTNYNELQNRPTLGTAAATDITDYATAAQGTKADTAVQPAQIADFETTTELNARDTENRKRANHTGEQAISTVTGLQTALDGKQPTGDYATNTALTSGLATKADTSSLAPVATSGDYTDLTNKPTIPVITGKADITYVDSQDTSVASTAQSNLTAHTSNTANPHSVTKAQVGLGNADNTNDMNKPVSTAQAAADALKVNKAGDETIAGVKTFSSPPVVPSIAVGSGRLFISSTAPSSPLEGDLWVDLS